MSSVARDPSDVALQELSATPLAVDTVLVRPTVGPLAFRSAGAPNDAEVEQVLATIRRRVDRLVRWREPRGFVQPLI